MKAILTLGVFSAMLGITANGGAANLPLANASAVAKIEQQLVDSRWDPAGKCSAPTRYAARCVWHASGHLWVKTFSKAGTHLLRIHLVGDYGDYGDVTKTYKLPPSDHLYRYV